MTEDLSVMWMISSFNSSEFSFEKFSSTDDQNLLVTLFGLAVITSALIGIFANILVILLSFGHVQGDFRLFVANLAVVDILCGCVFIFMGYINVNKNHNFPSYFLYIMTLAFYGSFGTMICAIVPISLSRAVALFKTDLRIIVRGKQAIFFCIICDIVPIGILCLICVVDYDISKVLYYTFATITSLAYVIAFTTNYVVFTAVAKHIKVVENLRGHARLIETRQVAIATFAQATIPLFCQVPAFLTLSSMLLLSEPITNGEIVTITQLWLAFSPFLDALITIIVIKQYRKHCWTCLSNLSKKIWNPKKNNTMFDCEKLELNTNK